MQSDLRAALKHLRGRERHFLRTGIGPGATGILGVFPTCTCRRRYMYISEPYNSLIINKGINKRDTLSEYVSFTIQRYEIKRRNANRHRRRGACGLHIYAENMQPKAARKPAQRHAAQEPSKTLTRRRKRDAERTQTNWRRRAA